VLLFAKTKNREVQAFLSKLVNNNCSNLEALRDGPRLEGRVRLTMVVLVIPLEKGRPDIERMFAAVSKEFSSNGVALVSNEEQAAEDVILGFRWEGTMKFTHGETRHLSPMGAGFYQLGVQLTEVVSPGDYPELRSVTF
jgi:hypothetical protein